MRLFRFGHAFAHLFLGLAAMFHSIQMRRLQVTAQADTLHWQTQFQIPAFRGMLPVQHLPVAILAVLLLRLSLFIQLGVNIQPLIRFLVMTLEAEIIQLLPGTAAQKIIRMTPANFLDVLALPVFQVLDAMTGGTGQPSLVIRLHALWQFHGLGHPHSYGMVTRGQLQGAGKWQEGHEH